MKTCQNCGNQMQDFDVICPTCGMSAGRTNSFSQQPTSNPYNADANESNQSQPNVGYNAYGNAQQSQPNAGYNAYGNAQQSQPNAGYNTYGNVQQTQMSQNVYGGGNNAPYQKPKSKKGLIIGLTVGAVVLVLAMVAAIVVLLLGNSSPQKVAEKAAVATMEMDFDALNKLAPFDCYGLIGDSMGDDYSKSDIKNQAQSFKVLVKTQYQSEYGSNYKITAKAKSTETINQSEYSDYVEEIEDYIKESNIKEMKKVTVELKIKGSLGSDTDEMDVIVAKVKGKTGWRFLTIEGGF